MSIKLQLVLVGLSLAAAQGYRSDDVSDIVDVDVDNGMTNMELTNREAEEAYAVYISAERKTCKGTYQIGTNVQGQSAERCAERCDGIENCKFYFYTTNNWCVLYSACDQTRTPGALGSTFKKKIIDQVPEWKKEIADVKNSIHALKDSVAQVAQNLEMLYQEKCPGSVLVNGKCPGTTAGATAPATTTMAGTTTAATTASEKCTDYQSWADKDGDGCDAYDGCTDVEKFANADGIDALAACCVCGGGIKEGVCTPGYGYHSGTMVNSNAPGKNVAECLEQCNILPECKFWDFGDNFCRLRSNDGEGPEVAELYTSGTKYCQLEFLGMDGACRYGHNDYDYMGPGRASSVNDCQQDCKNTNGCTAVTFQYHTLCSLYRGGPYHGDGNGDSLYTCYALQG